MVIESLSASRPPVRVAAAPELVRAEPVWRYIDDAVSMSFAMEHREASVRSSTAAVIQDLMEIRYGLPPTINEERRVNMGSLRPIEFRAQCAEVRGTIERPENRAGITTVQRWVILARFGYQMKRASGVLGLAEHFGSLCNSQNPSAVKALIWGHYEVRSKKARTPGAVIKARGDWSLRAIEKEYSVSKSVLGRDRKLLTGLLHGTESQALMVLDSHFRGIGLVGDF